MPRAEIVKMYDTFAGLRRANIGVIDSVPAGKVAVIPKGLKNSIYWQAGHLVTAQASLLHRRFGRALPVPESFFRYFGKGTSPAGWDENLPPFSVVRPELERAVAATMKELDRLENLTYPEPFTVTAGLTIASFEEGLTFLSIHEAYHLGEMMVMIKCL